MLTLKSLCALIVVISSAVSKINENNKRKNFYSQMNHNKTANYNKRGSLSYSFEMCIITRVQNVPNLIPQWVNYHEAIGVDRIFITDDCSTDRRTPIILEVLASQNKILTYLKASDLPFLNCSSHRPDETLHFHDLFFLTRHTCRWIACIDVDEYIFPVNNPEHTIRFLPNILAKEQHSTVIRMPWMLMSTHGQEYRRSGLIIERFTAGIMNVHVKTMAKSSVLDDWMNSHFPIFKHGRDKSYGEHPFARKWELNLSEPCPIPKISPIVLRHFQGMSWQEYMELRGARSVTSGNDVNIWAIDARDKWLALNFSAVCPPNDSVELFRKKIAMVLGSPEPLI